LSHHLTQDHAGECRGSETFVLLHPSSPSPMSGNFQIAHFGIRERGRVGEEAVSRGNDQLHCRRRPPATWIFLPASRHSLPLIRMMDGRSVSATRGRRCSKIKRTFSDALHRGGRSAQSTPPRLACPTNLQTWHPPSHGATRAGVGGDGQKVWKTLPPN